MTTQTVLILNGPNLNLLGYREPEIYGTVTLEDIEEACRKKAESLALEIAFEQTNHEGTMVDRLQWARTSCAGIIINPGAYTHTSIALLDSLLVADLPAIEVHLSNIHRRESFRRTSFVSQAVRGVICGFGAKGYLLALDAMAELIQQAQD